MSVDLSQVLQALIEDRKACEGTWPRNGSVEMKNNRGRKQSYKRNEKGKKMRLDSRWSY